MSIVDLRAELARIAADSRPADLYDRALLRSGQIRRRRGAVTAITAAVAVLVIGAATWSLLPSGTDPRPPAATTSTQSSSPTQSAASTPAVTESASGPVLGPFGFGDLRLGMTKVQAQASGSVTGVDSAAPACGGPGDGHLVGAPDQAGDGVDGRLFFSDRGLVAIYAYPGVVTPEGVGLGSTRAQVEAAYPGFQTVGGSPEGHGGVPVPGNPDAHYRIDVQGDVVIQLSLDSNRQNCYE